MACHYQWISHCPPFTVDFETFPSDGCAAPGDSVEFNCTAFYSHRNTTIPAVQKWVITPSLGSTIMFVSGNNTPLPPPLGFNFIGGIVTPSGIRVTANSNLSNATFQCIVINPLLNLTNESMLATATLHDAGKKVGSVYTDI